MGIACSKTKSKPLNINTNSTADASNNFTPSNAKNGNNSGPKFENDTTQTHLYKKGTLLAEGAYGKVYQCLDMNTGQIIAVKSVKLSKEKTSNFTKDIKILQDEINILSSLSHKNIVRYIHASLSENNTGCITHNSVVDIYFEYVPGGSLRNIIDKFGAFEEKIAKLYTKQILEGLEYLHSKGIIHRDIKAANMLLDTDGNVKLSDFGTSKVLKSTGEDVGLSRSLKGSPFWMAPEVVLQVGHGTSADIWSVGCTLIEMLTASPPYSNNGGNTKDVLRQIASGKLPTFPPKATLQCKDFLEKCLCYKPDERKTTTELISHPFISLLPAGESYEDSKSMLSKSRKVQELRSQLNYTEDQIHGNSRFENTLAQNHSRLEERRKQQQDEEDEKKQRLDNQKKVEDALREALMKKAN